MKAKFTRIETIAIEIEGNEAERVLLKNFIESAVGRGIWVSGSGSTDGKTDSLYVSLRPEVDNVK